MNCYLNAICNNLDNQQSDKSQSSSSSLINYKIINQLSQELSGKIYESIFITTNEKRIIHVVDISKYTKVENDFLYLTLYKLIKFDHPNVLKVYQYFEHAKKIYIVTEQFNRNPLLQNISDISSFTEYKAQNIILQALSALQYCYQNDIELLDIILLYDKESNLIELSYLNYLKAPEAIAGARDKSSNIWSLGVIFFILLCGQPPIEDDEIDMNNGQLQKQEKYHSQLEQSNQISNETKQLAKAMLEINPQQRITLESAFQFQWITQENGNKLDMPNQVLLKRKQFINEKNLIRQIYSYIITRKQIKFEMVEQQQALSFLDQNSDSNPYKNEIIKASTKVMHQIEAEYLVYNFCDNIEMGNNGSIDIGEFIMVNFHISKQKLQNNLIMALCSYFNNDSQISLKDITNILKNLAEYLLTLNLDFIQIQELHQILDEFAY